MSEYQYYYFQAIDQPLSKQQMQELRAISTQAEITPASFINTYNWGDLKADPRELMHRYFDAHVYVAILSASINYDFLEQKTRVQRSLHW
jgi:hypothetical protein